MWLSTDHHSTPAQPLLNPHPETPTSSTSLAASFAFGQDVEPIVLYSGYRFTVFSAGTVS
jgi:hypothetical protein